MAGIDLGRLKTAVDLNFKRMQPYRESRFKFIQQYVGYHYSKKGLKSRIPVNMMAQAVIIYIQKLVSSNPKAFVTNFNSQLRNSAVNLGLAMDQSIREIEYKSTLQKVILDALFGFGVVKKGVALQSKVEFNGFTHDVGQVFVDHTSIDDFVFDMAAKRWDQCSFMGNKYRLPCDFAIESGQFDPDILKKMYRLKTLEFRKTNESGGDYETEGLSRDAGGSSEEEFLDYFEMIDIWLPYHGKVLTMPYASSEAYWGAPLREADWMGPESGPFNILSFHDVPDQILPLPPAALWMDLHELGNKIFRMLGKQAERSKTILAVARGGGKDAEKILEAADGEAIGVTSPEKCQEYKFGGVDNVGLAFFLQLKELFSYYAGNLDTLGGLGAVTDTVGQDKLLSESSNEMVNGMRDRVYDFTKRDFKDISWYLWYDPLTEIPFTKPITGTNINIDYVYTDEDKEGDYLDYNFNVVPYSMQEDTPTTKLAKLSEVFNTFMPILMPMMQQQGIMVNAQNFLDIIARYSNLPELNHILMFASGQSQEGEPIGTPASKTTKRTYERINRPGATIGGKTQAMMTALLSGMNSGQQPSQAAGITRSVG
jgi:hypothetical protein